MCFVLKSLVAVLAVSCALQAANAEQPVVRHVKVSYADLDLSNERSATEVLRRLDRAATAACGGRPVFGPLYREALVAHLACVDKAEGRAVAQVNHPLVNQLYASRHGSRDVKLARR